jgi:hypothetical protein
MSSLNSILKNFLININKDESSKEKSNICKLSYILDEYYQNKYENDDSDDDLDYSLFSGTIVKENTMNLSKQSEKCSSNENSSSEDESEVSTKEDSFEELFSESFLHNNINSTIELPTLFSGEQSSKENTLSKLKSCNKNIIKLWIELDKNESIENKLVLNECKQNLNDDYIIYLIETGFMPSILDTLYLAEYERFDLLKYYYYNNLPFNKYTGNEIVRQGRLDILDWLFSNNLIDSKYYNDLVDNAIIVNDIFIMDYLMNFHNIKPLDNIYERLNYEFSKNIINNVMLSWLWGNGIRWTKDQAIQFNNIFMLNFYKKTVHFT